MDGLSPHIDYRVESLHREAEARRLAASATPPHLPKPPRRGHGALGIARALLALAVIGGASGAYLVVAASPDPPAPVRNTSTTDDEEPATDPGGLEHAIRPPWGPALLTYR